jgi:hypothetical protein
MARCILASGINLIGRQQEAAQISLDKTRECDHNHVGLKLHANCH